MSEITTKGKVIRCKAAVAWMPKAPLKIETIEVAPPKEHEVRIKIVSTGVCHTDAWSLSGEDKEGTVFPVILGHEGAGIVESVGEGVKSLVPGDHVIPVCVPQCRECEYCLHENTNLCQRIQATQMKGLMPDGTSRFSLNGKPIFHFMGTSTFSEYTVCSEISVAKISKSAPLDKVGLLGCGISTGYGAVMNTAKVQKGSKVAVWGLGCVGLAVIMGAKEAGATQIIGIDLNPNKFPTAMEFGATQCLNPKDFDSKRPLQDVLLEKFDGGFDYTFECAGDVTTMRSALESAHKGWGVAVVIGLPPAGKEICTSPLNLVNGRTWTGSALGDWKTRDQVPKLVDKYLKKTIKVDEFISHTYPIEEINKAFDNMNDGKSLRSVINL